jgi:hypothetical protein
LGTCRNGFLRLTACSVASKEDNWVRDGILGYVYNSAVKRTRSEQLLLALGSGGKA